MGSYSVSGEYHTQILVRCTGPLFSSVFLLIVWNDFGFKKATDYIYIYIYNYLMK